MGKYSDIESMLIQRGQNLFPFVEMDKPRDWRLIEEVLENIPLDGERLMTEDELFSFYE